MEKFRRVGLALLGFGVISLLAGYVLLMPQMHLAQDPANGVCYQAGEGKPVGGAEPESFVSLFPAGLACSWAKNDGSIYTVHFGEWWLSAFLSGGVLSGVSGFVLLLLPPRRREPALEQGPG